MLLLLLCLISGGVSSWGHRLAFVPSPVDYGAKSTSSVRLPVYNKNDTISRVGVVDSITSSQQTDPRFLFNNNNNCQNLNHYNPPCCNLGYRKCCQQNQNNYGWGHQQIKHPKPIIHNVGWGHNHRPHPPPIYKPINYGWEKAGSCFYKSPFSFLSNLFSSSNNNKGWGWSPPSQNAGYHFYRRHDITKREGIRSGWALQNTNCFQDDQCPDLQKCCHGLCKSPNFTL